MRKLISLLAASAMALSLLALPALADEEAVTVDSAAPSMEERSAADIAAEDAAAMADAGLNTNVPASSAPTDEQAALDEAAAGVPTQPKEEAAADTSVSGAVLPFKDVPVSNPFYSAILHAYQHDLFRGYGDDTFRPETGMTRAMFVTVLYRQASKLGQDMAVKAASAFTDIAASNQEFQTAINWAAERGIVNGKTPTTFVPNETVSRQQACAIIVRYLRDFLGYDMTGFQTAVQLSDAAQISEYARDAVTIALNMGLVSADTVNGAAAFQPWLSASRAVVAKVMAVSTEKLPSLKKAPAPIAPDPEIANPVPTNPDSGANTGSRPSGGGGGGGGSTPVTPANPTPADPTPVTPVTHTEEEIAQEETAVGHMRKMLESYDKHTITNQAVKAAYDVMMDTLRLAVADHDSGNFVDRLYVSEHYADRVRQFKSMYNALSAEDQQTFQDQALYFGTMKQFQTVADFFQVDAEEMMR